MFYEREKKMNVNKKFYGEHLSHMETVKSKAVNMANLM